MSEYDNVHELICDVASVLEPSERLTVSEANAKYRVMNNPGSYVGPWKNETVPYMVEPMDVLASREYNAEVFVGPAQCGKGLPLTEVLPSPDGWVTMGNIQVGDRLFDEFSDKCNVVFVSEIHIGLPCYKVNFDDGTDIITDDVHKWTLTRGLSQETVTTEELDVGDCIIRHNPTKTFMVANVIPVESVPTRCIQVDSPNHLFLAGRQMVPTHNTDALLVNWVLHNVVCDPADMILYQTSQGIARDFSKRRIDRLHRHSPEVGRRLMRRADADNTHDKHYTSGIMVTLSWPTINELSGRPIGRVALTDYDRMPQNIDGEGAPFDLARKRTTTFGSFAMTLAESSPGYSVSNQNWMPATKHEAPPAPGILALYNRGDKRRWQWPCSHCDEYYEPSFSLIKWVPSKDIMEAAESAQMVCPHCGGLNNHDQKHEFNNNGHWVPDGMELTKCGLLVGKRPNSDIASFWLKGPAATFASWKTLVTNYLKAEAEFEKTGDQEPLKSTVNTDQGEPYYPRGVGGNRLPEDLKSRSEDFGSDEPVVPYGVRFLIATIDVQKNRWVVQIHGVLSPPRPGTMFDTVVVDRFDIKKSKRFDTDGDRMWVQPGVYLEDWDLIRKEVIQTSYPLEDGSGRRMYIKTTGCDSGGLKGVTSMAYQFWLGLRTHGLHGKFVLIKGLARPNAPRVEVTYPDNAIKGIKPGLTGQIPVMMVNTDKVKDHLDNCLDRLEAGGMIRFNDLLSDSFYAELTAEMRDDKGKWTNSRKLRNESWDLLVYHFALCFKMRVEYMDWSNTPGWANDWDDNDLVFGEKELNTLAPTTKGDYSTISELGNLLG
jgi:phage terminase large subunit GpA-like protein